jgi:hypothetical protein
MTEHIWATRLPGESPKAFAAFECYRDMGSGRSIEKVGERLVKNPVALARLSKRHEWVKRTAAFDSWVSDQKAQETAREIIEMKRRHAEQALFFQEVALLPSNEMKEKMNSATRSIFDEDFSRLSTRELWTWVVKSLPAYKLAATMERSARVDEQKRSQPTSRSDKVPTPTIGPDLLNMIEELIDKKIREKMFEHHKTQPQNKQDTEEEKTVRGLEGERAEDRPTTIGVKSLLENQELLGSVKDLINNRLEQALSSHHDSQSEDKSFEGDEGSSIESKKNPELRPALRRRPRLVTGASPVDENRSVDSALLRGIEKKGEEQ